jgi:hypothetical protein
MKAITICQPYAHLILLPDSDEDHKRAENRNWPCGYRGPLLIHAGKSRQWMDEDDARFEKDLVFGAIVGQVDMVACFHIGQIHPDLSPPGIKLRPLPLEFHWLRKHRHCSGLWCHIYANPVRFAKPIPYRGAQGLFDVPDEVLQHPAMAAGCGLFD